MVGNTDRSIQVLNISNVNAQGKTVLNDGKLLDLIQRYPFLYSPRVRAYDDADYENWAWKNINAEFNRSYSNDPNAAFSTQDLIERWHALKPLIQCLSKAYDLEAIPQSLRKSVVRISTELENPTCNVLTKPNNFCQDLLLQNMSSIGELSLEKKLALEREILDLMLSSELECKKATNLDRITWKDIYQDTEEFINDIGFKHLLLTSVSNGEKIAQSSYCNQYSRRKHIKQEQTLGWVPLEDADKYVKPCSVMIKRISIDIEDYLPLAKIIQLNKMKNTQLKPGCSDRDSPGIFGL